MKNILLLGATGSIGDSALDVIAQNPDSLNLYGMAFHSNIGKGSNIAFLLQIKAPNEQLLSKRQPLCHKGLRYHLRGINPFSSCFTSHFLSNEWDLVHISYGGGMVKSARRVIFSHVR